jgi:hypothetical protein
MVLLQIFSEALTVSRSQRAAIRIARGGDFSQNGS